MPAPDPSRLDANQVLQGAYDESTGRLRTDSEATVVNADIHVQLDSADDNVAIADPDGDFLEINPDGSINVKIDEPLEVEGTIQISNISSAIDVNPVQVVGITDPIVVSNITSPVDVSGSTVSISAPVNVIVDEPLITTIQGTVDGDPTSTPYYLVYSRKSQILDSHDRVADFTYADFGTKNQRITRIDYTSATFPGVIIRRVFNYTLVGNSYQRDNEMWSII